MAKYLTEHAVAHCREHYYDVRARYNRGGAQALQAARFIYLNAAGFNGVFRVNKQGQYNVPIGRKRVPLLPSAEHLLAISKTLRGARLLAGSYDQALSTVDKYSFVYLDPPYPPLNGTSYFTHYTHDRFSLDDQEALADQVRHLARAGARFLLSNADTPMIRKLYKGFNVSSLDVTRWVSCKAVRYKVREVAITNYQPM